MLKRALAMFLELAVLILAFAGCASAQPAEGGSEVTTLRAGESTVIPETTAHVHEYTVTVTEPTLTERGYVTSTCACGDSVKEYNTGVVENTEKLTVLFIGNSYTYYNDMPTAIFKKIVNGQGIGAVVLSVTKGGYTLVQFADPSNTYGKQIDSLLAARDIDIIFMQEQSVTPAQIPGKFFDGVRGMKKKLDPEGAKVILYQTWGRKAPNTNLTANGWTTETMAIKLAAAYEAIAEETGYHLSPVGSAFLDVYKNHPSINLYSSDNSHPSAAGSYLAALCHYAALYGTSPIGVEYKHTFTDKVAEILQTAAHKAVFGDSIVTEEYRMTSEGVELSDSQLEGNLDKIPSSKLISVGIKGDNGKLCSPAVSSSRLTEKQINDLADITYGISIIGVKDLHRSLDKANNGIWSGGKAQRLSFHFNGKHYGIGGNEDENEKYSALITFNFGKTVTLDAIGYMSGSMDGFAQAQDVFISEDGVTWAKVESACYDAISLKSSGSALKKIASPKDKSGKTASACTMFDMGGVRAKYVRVGIITGVVVNDWDTNTYELAIYGKDQ